MVCEGFIKQGHTRFDDRSVGDRMRLLTLQDIFCASYPAYERTHALPAHVHRAARAIMPCRTVARGGHVQACPDGHRSRLWYNACRHRSCPPCASLHTERWLALQQARRLACEHSPGIFTLPHERNPLWLANVPVMTALLLQAVRDTLGLFLAAPKSLGAPPGIIAALHTWSQTLVRHPHVPCLVTGGGLTASGHWQAVRTGFLWPARVVMAVLRGQRLAAIRQAWAREELLVPEARRPQPWLHGLHRLGQAQTTPWQVHMRERYRHGAGGVTSLARSLRGGPIKHARLVAWDGERVTCTYRTSAEAPASGGTSRSCMTVASADVLQRWLRHVPAPQRRVVRSSGLSHHTHAETLAHGRTVLGQPPVEVPACLDWQTVCAPWQDVHPERCPMCDPLLVCTGVIPRGGAPPLLEAGERAA